MIDKKKLQEEYNNLKKDLLHSLADIVSCPSVYDSNTITAKTPFGKGMDDALSTILAICSKLGMKTFKDPDGFYGYAEIGEGKELTGVLCHLDVVPVEDPHNWYNDPFTLTEIEDKLIARGVSDNKGPTIVSLYALKALMNTNFPFQKRIRFIFGTDEESLWRCINRYIEKEEIPSLGFTPDARFPVIFAEKGLLQFTLKTNNDTITIKGGGALNAVPFSIEYHGIKQEELIQELQVCNFEYTKNNNSITIHGKPAHAAETQLGINPICRLIIALYHIGVHSPSIDFIAEMIQESPYGEPLFGMIEDEMSGKLKTNLARIDINPEESTLYFDFRIPVTIDPEQLITIIKQKAQRYGLQYNLFDLTPALYIPKDNPLIKILCSIYHEETGFDTTPLSIGGATYSRAMKNFVSYGMQFPDGESTAHQTNEYIRIKDIERAFIIYAKALAFLSQ